MSASPLSGMRVVDLSRHLPGPLAAHLLADLGARVVKVEEPALGDPVRLAPPRGALGALVLAGVESVALDLKSPAARGVLERLLARADVLLETFRPGTLARLGLDPENLRRRFPRLVICSVSGWGQQGPYASRAGHDLTYQALAGALAPSPRTPALPLADLVGAWSAVTAILAALYERERTGAGSRIDAALFDAALHGNLVGWAAEAAGPQPVGKPQPLSGALPCYGVYRTADGAFLAVAALEPHFWRRFCEAAGRPDLLRHQYSTAPRVKKQMEALLAARTRDQWLELLSGRDVPVEPVLSPSEARSHPQAIERGVVTEGPDALPRVAFPARFDGERPRAGARVPDLGEQTAAVLAELGIEAARLPRREKRALGIGRRPGWRRLLARLLAR